MLQSYAHISGPEGYDISRAASVLVQRLRGALTTSALQPKRGRPYGQLDQRRIAQLATNVTPNVFTQRQLGEAVDTVVAVSVDLSGSMGNYLRIAYRTVLILNDALGKLKIPLHVNGWSGGGDICQILVAKEFDEAYTAPTVVNALAGNGFNLGGGTPSPAALGWTLERIAKRHERRKIVLFLTDGVPNNSHGSYGYALTQMDKAARNGIEIIPVAMGETAVRAFHQLPLFKQRNVVPVETWDSLDRDVSNALVREILRTKGGRKPESVAGARHLIPDTFNDPTYGKQSNPYAVYK